MSKFGEGKANGKEKSSFFSAFGKKKKADKPQYDGDMKHGKANGKVCRPAAKRTSSPATHLTAISRRPHVFVCICRLSPPSNFGALSEKAFRFSAAFRIAFLRSSIQGL